MTPPDADVIPAQTARLRSWIWSGPTATVGLLFAGVSVGALLDAGRIETGGVITVAISLLVAGRALVLRVDLTADHLVVHSWLRTQRFPRAEIVTLAAADYNGLLREGSSSRYFYELRLTTGDGRVHPVRAVVTRAASGRAARFARTVNNRPR